MAGRTKKEDSTDDDLPGGQYKRQNFLEVSPRNRTIGDKAGSATRKGGVAGAVGKLSDKLSGGGPDDEIRAYTPKEAQKAQANVDKDDMRKKADGVAGAIPSYKKGGMVKKTGLARLHRGEKVIRKKDVKRTTKAVRKYAGKKS